MNQISRNFFRFICFFPAIFLALFMGCNSSTQPPSKLTNEPSSSAATEPLRVYGKVPPFHLTDQNDQDFDSDTLTGKVWLATFFFTTCPSTCPVQSAEVARLQKFEGLEFVSITVQPEADTPEVLTKYANNYRADLSRWHFLTGERETIWELSKTGFFLPVGDAPPYAKMPIFHSSKIILIDQHRQIRGFYESQTRSEMNKLSEDIGTFLKSTRETHRDEGLEALELEMEGAFDSTEHSTTTDRTRIVRPSQR